MKRLMPAMLVTFKLLPMHAVDPIDEYSLPTNDVNLQLHFNSIPISNGIESRIFARQRWTKCRSHVCVVQETAPIFVSVILIQTLYF